jgi:hypothetical protein
MPDRDSPCIIPTIPKLLDVAQAQRQSIRLIGCHPERSEPRRANAVEGPEAEVNASFDYGSRCACASAQDDIRLWL